MPTMPSLDAPTDGQRLRAESLMADGYSAADVVKFAHAEWRVAQRIAVDASTDLQPLSNAEQAHVRQWINEMVPAEDVIAALREKRALHQDRQFSYRELVNARRREKKAAKRAKQEPDA